MYRTYGIREMYSTGMREVGVSIPAREGGGGGGRGSDSVFISLTDLAQEGGDVRERVCVMEGGREIA